MKKVYLIVREVISNGSCEVLFVYSNEENARRVASVFQDSSSLDYSYYYRVCSVLDV